MNFWQVKDIIKLSIHDICVNPENPRHDVVMDLGESFIMQQLISTKKDTQAMYKLICDIYNAGWFVQSIVTVTYDSEKKKYIAWDGNRRLTALKILYNPKLINNFKYFSYTQIKNINDMHKKIPDDSFYEVSCYVADSFEDCADYIRTIHTTDTGALPWSDVAKKRFENKLGLKNTFSQLKEYCGTPFEGISDNFSVNKFEKLVNSKVGKEYLGINNTDHILTHKIPIEELEAKLTKIVKDIDMGILKNNNIKNATEMKKYLYGEEKIIIDKNEIILSNGSDKKVIQKNNIEEINNREQNAKREIAIKQDNINEQLSIINPNQYEIINKDKQSIFKTINIRKLKMDNPRTIGIVELCYEIQQMCLKFDNKKYSIAFSLLIRSLLEQSSIYFLINKDRWEKLKKGNNDKELRLEQIIKELEKSKSMYFDETTLRCWDTFNNNTSTKDYFDMIVHHPYLIRANNDVIDNISDSGLFAIIQYFINN